MEVIEGCRPHTVILRDEDAELVKNWGRKSTDLQRLTENQCDALSPYFADESEFMDAKGEIKYLLVESLDEESKQIFDSSNLLLNKKRRTADENLLTDNRNLVLNRIRNLFESTVSVLHDSIQKETCESSQI